MRPENECPKNIVYISRFSSCTNEALQYFLPKSTHQTKETQFRDVVVMYSPCKQRGEENGKKALNHDADIDKKGY